MRVVELQALANRHLHLPVGPIEARKLQVGVVAEGDRHGPLTDATTVVAIVSVDPRRLASKSTSCGKGNAAISSRWSAKSKLAARTPPLSVASCRFTRHPTAAARRPCIGSPLGSRVTVIASSRSTSAPATENRVRASRFAQGWSSGIPIVERSAMYVRRPPRWPRSSCPRWRSEHPTMSALGTKVASTPPVSSVVSVSAGLPSIIRSPISGCPQSG
jgi:hypothetical protein